MTLSFIRRVGALALLLLAAPAGGQATALNIVAIGASNTSGWGVGTAGAYPARLEALLRAKGYDAHVTNAGVPFETTAGMLDRIDADVPDGTQIVILQPGANDVRFLRTRASRDGNIAAMVKRLQERKIKVIVFDPDFARQYYQWDFIHINSDGHAWIAATLLPQVITAAAASAPRTGTTRATRSPPAAPANAKSP